MGLFIVFFILSLLLLSYPTYWGKTQDFSFVDSRKGRDQSLEWIPSVFLKKNDGR